MFVLLHQVLTVFRTVIYIFGVFCFEKVHPCVFIDTGLKYRIYDTKINTTAYLLNG